MSTIDVHLDVASSLTARHLGWRTKASTRATVGIVAAAIAVVVEAAFFLLDLPALVIGDVNASPSTLPALVAAAAGADRIRGRARTPLLGVVYWIAATGALAASLVLTGNVIDATTQFGLWAAAFDEEIIYRFAGPALVTFGLTTFGTDHRRARTIGYLLCSTAFVFLPGHVAQWTSAADAAPFVAFAALATVAVHRSGAVLEVGMLHAVFNLVNIGRMAGQVNSTATALLAIVSILLVVAFVPPFRRAPLPDLVVDLTGPEPRIFDDRRQRPRRHRA